MAKNGFRSSLWFTVLTCAYSAFADIFLQMVLVPVLPFALVGRVSIVQKDAQRWVSVMLTMHALALLIVSPIAGVWSDQMNRKVPFLVGIASLAVATIIVCLARSLSLFVFGRLMQGISSAIFWTISTAILSRRCAGTKHFGQCLGYMTLARSVALVGGPMVGGLVYENAGWYPTFGVSFGLLGVDMALRLMMVETEPVRLDLAVDRQSQEPSSDAHEKTAVAAMVGELPYHEDKITWHQNLYSQHDSWDRIRARILDHARFARQPRFILVMLSNFMQAVAITALDSTLPLFVARTFKWRAAGAGLVYLAQVAPAILTPILGIVCGRWGCRWLITGAFALSLPTLVCLRFVDQDELGDKVLMCALFAMIGLLLAVFEVTSWVEANVCCTQQDQSTKVVGEGAVFGIVNSAFAGGALVGPLWGGFVYQDIGWDALGLSLGVSFGVLVVPAAIWVGSGSERNIR